MRRLAAAALAVPVIASIYAPALFRRRTAVPLTGGLVVLAVAILALGSFSQPAPAAGRLPGAISPVTSSHFGPVVGVNHAATQGIVVQFSSAMNPASVAAALRVDPPGQVRLEWNEAATQLTVVPETGWALGTFYTVTVGAEAEDAAGQALAGPARAAFLVRSPVSASMAATKLVGSRVASTSRFTIRFDGPVDLASASEALRIKPNIAGHVSAVGGVGQPGVLTFVPSSPLAPNTTYTISLKGSVVDQDGQPIVSPAPLTVKTLAAPAVVQFRPTKGSDGIDPTAVISVRFTQAMNRASTAKAFSVVIGGHAIAGTVSWAEGNTVLLFRPKSALPAGAGVGVRLAGTALSADGAQVGSGSSATFRVQAAPPVKPIATTTAKTATATPATTTTPSAPKTATTTAPKTSTSSSSSSSSSAPRSSSSGGSSVGGGSWAAVEAYYLKLMNCTRTGGWVTGSGDCSGAGGRDVAPLWIDEGISDKVTRPFAKLVVTTGNCSHFADGSPANRLARAGYTSYRWAENMSCPQSMSPMAAMVYTQQFFQNEKSYGGGHYVNLMNPLYDRVGIGVWVANGRVEVVIDFYHP